MFMTFKCREHFFECDAKLYGLTNQTSSSFLYIEHACVYVAYSTVLNGLTLLVRFFLLYIHIRMSFSQTQIQFSGGV